MMKRSRILWLFTLLVLFCGCAKTAPTEKTELWVVTEESTTDGMNLQARLIAADFEAAHPGITVRLEYLPTDSETRETYLQQLRTQIMAGNGPDVYLLPTGDTFHIGTAKTLKDITMEPLFPDVQQSMYSGLFRDINALYDADADLDTDALHPDIMDAGCIGDARYLLPLRFDMTVLMTDEANWAASGMNPALAEGDLRTLMRSILTSDATQKATCGLQLPTDICALPQLFDYENGELLVTQEQIADYLHLYQDWMEAFSQLVLPVYAKADEDMHAAVEPRLWELCEFPVNDISAFNGIDNYQSYGLNWTEEGFPVFLTDMENMLDSTLTAKRLGQNVTMRVLRDIAGQSHAMVTYFGAVGSGCSDPELAYAFLREFLTEQYQWDLYRPRVKKTPDPFDLELDEIQCEILVEKSWPVRVTGSGEPLWDTRQYQLYHGSGMRRRILGVAAENVLKNDDFSVLTEPLDVVDFRIAQAEEETLAYALSQLNDENGTPTDIDVEALAQQVYEDLWWHLAEG